MSSNDKYYIESNTGSIDIPIKNMTFLNNKITINFWVRIPALNKYIENSPIISILGNNKKRIGIQYSRTSAFWGATTRFIINEYDENNTVKRIYNKTEIPYDKWINITIVIDNNHYNIFQDDLVSTYVGNNPIRSIEKIILFGTEYGKDNFLGQLSNISIWNDALSKDKITEIKKYRLDGREDSLVGAWPLNEGKHRTVYDITPNDNHGSMKGVVRWKNDLPLEFTQSPIIPIQFTHTPTYSRKTQDYIFLNWNKSGHAIRYVLERKENNSNWETVNDTVIIPEYIYQEFDCKKDVQFRVKAITPHGETNWSLSSRFDVIKESNISGELYISPKSLFKSSVNIIPPELYRYKNKAIHDTFVSKEAEFVNYGQMLSIVSGKEGPNEYITYIMFDIKSIREDINIQNIYLSLFQTYNKKNISNIKIYKTHNNWSEDWIKWTNKPTLGDLITEQEIEIKHGQIKVDMKDYYFNEINRQNKRVSFAITSDNPLSFYTKENNDSRAPAFIVDYFELSKNGDKHEIFGEIDIAINKVNSAKGQLEVMTEFLDTSRTGSLSLNSIKKNNELNGDFIVTLFDDINIDGDTFLTKHHILNTGMVADSYIAWLSEVNSMLDIPKNNTDSSITGELFTLPTSNKSFSSDVLLVESSNDNMGPKGNLTMSRFRDDGNISGDMHIDSYLAHNDLQLSIDLPKQRKNDNGVNSDIYIVPKSVQDMDGQVNMYQNHVDLDLQGKIDTLFYCNEEKDGSIILAKTEKSKTINSRLFITKTNANTNIRGSISPAMDDAHEIDGWIYIVHERIADGMQGVIKVEININDYVYIS